MSKTLPVYLETRVVVFLGYVQVEDLSEFNDKAQELWESKGRPDPFTYITHNRSTTEVEKLP